jgi:ATP-dependent Clp protease ATP-binding subunit ClpC
MLDNFDIFFDKKIGQKLTNHAKSTLSFAFELAKRQKASETGNIHLFCAIYSQKGSMGSVILKDMGIKKNHLDDFLARKTSKISSRSFPPASEELKKTMVKAFSIAKNLKYSYVGTEHLIYAILDSQDKTIGKIIRKTERKKTTSPSSAFKTSLLGPSDQKNSLSDYKNFPVSFPEWQSMPEIFPATPNEKKNSSKTTLGTPYIDKFCINLNEEVEVKGDTVIGRDKETKRIINILGRKNKNNPLLIGQPGVGKTALVLKLAQYINEDEVPSFMLGKKIMNLDVAALIAGTSFRGEFESRLKEIIKEAAKNKDVILFIDEIHNIVGAGNISGSLDLANILKPALSKGEIHMIGATTFKEYKQYIEKDAALERRFQTVAIKEPDQQEAKKILLGIKNDYEDFHNVSISDNAIELCVELSCRYIQDRFLPDKAIDVLDETASYVRSAQKISDFAKKIKELEIQNRNTVKEKEKNLLEENYGKALELKEKEEQLKEQIGFLRIKSNDLEKEQRAVIETQDIIETIAKISGIPAEKMARKSGQKIKNVSDILNSQIIGQKEIVEKLGSVLVRSQFGLSSPERPLGSFLFLGPSGVGKTLTAKILATEFFENQKNLIRIDMSEFMERHSVSALIGAPAGYVGYGEGGRLTEKVRRQPYSVVLFDEIEKAHSDVFNILLQILEEGVLTDAQGMEVSFKNTILILTTNIGTEEFNEIHPAPLGFKLPKKSDTEAKKIETIRLAVTEELEYRLKPELLNRLDHILIFNPLSKSDIEKITGLEIEKLKKRLEKQGIDMQLGKGVVSFIAQKSTVKKRGARMVRKNIQELVENEIAQMMVEDRVKNNKITVSAGKGKLKLA